MSEDVSKPYTTITLESRRIMKRVGREYLGEKKTKSTVAPDKQPEAQDNKRYTI